MWLWKIDINIAWHCNRLYCEIPAHSGITPIIPTFGPPSLPFMVPSWPRFGETGKHPQAKKPKQVWGSPLFIYPRLVIRSHYPTHFSWGYSTDYLNWELSILVRPTGHQVIQNISGDGWPHKRTLPWLSSLPSCQNLLLNLIVSPYPHYSFSLLFSPINSSSPTLPLSLHYFSSSHPFLKINNTKISTRNLPFCW